MGARRPVRTGCCPIKGEASLLLADSPVSAPGWALWVGVRPWLRVVASWRVGIKREVLGDGTVRGGQGLFVWLCFHFGGFLSGLALCVFLASALVLFFVLLNEWVPGPRRWLGRLSHSWLAFDTSGAGAKGRSCFWHLTFGCWDHFPVWNFR